jgi:hypothetical protein
MRPLLQSWPSLPAATTIKDSSGARLRVINPATIARSCGARSRSSASTALTGRSSGNATCTNNRPVPPVADTSATYTLSNVPSVNWPANARFSARCTWRHSWWVFCSWRASRALRRNSFSSKARSNSGSINWDAESRSRERFDTAIVSLGRTLIRRAPARDDSRPQTQESSATKLLKLWEPGP